jgi:4-aminobutyrate aminotransferase-like enzyme
MSLSSLKARRDKALGAGAELFYDEPLEIIRGEGVYLFDSAGRRYIDMYNNVPCVGHANPAVVQAMAGQQATLNVHSRYLHETSKAWSSVAAGPRPLKSPCAWHAPLPADAA